MQYMFIEMKKKKNSKGAGELCESNRQYYPKKSMAIIYIIFPMSIWKVVTKSFSRSCKSSCYQINMCSLIFLKGIVLNVSPVNKTHLRTYKDNL